MSYADYRLLRDADVFPGTTTLLHLDFSKPVPDHLLPPETVDVYAQSPDTPREEKRFALYYGWTGNMKDAILELITEPANGSSGSTERCFLHRDLFPRQYPGGHLAATTGRLNLNQQFLVHDTSSLAGHNLVASSDGTNHWVPITLGTVAKVDPATASLGAAMTELLRVYATEEAEGAVRKRFDSYEMRMKVVEERTNTLKSKSTDLRSEVESLKAYATAHSVNARLDRVFNSGFQVSFGPVLFAKDIGAPRLNWWQWVTLMNAINQEANLHNLPNVSYAIVFFYPTTPFESSSNIMLVIDGMPILPSHIQTRTAFEYLSSMVNTQLDLHHEDILNDLEVGAGQSHYSFRVSSLPASDSQQSINAHTLAHCRYASSKLADTTVGIIPFSVHR